MNTTPTTRLLVLVVAGAVLAACASLPTETEANEMVATLRRYQDWAWALGIALIWADLLLPVPQSTVIAALGIVYGTALGGLIGSVGLVSGGVLGYLAMRTALRRVVQRLAGRRSLDKVEGVFDRGGAWAIVLTRSLPYSIPEAVVFLAGIARMPPRKFLAALVAGSVPTAYLFAAIGDGWAHEPGVALVLSFVLPILLLPLALYLLRRRA